VFIPGGAYSKSTASKSFTVSQPAYTTLAGGVQIATIAPGSGPGIQSGQTAGVLYTGYLAKNGQIFDDSIRHGGTPLSFTLGAGQLIPGFDAGTVGMKPGETRVILIPPAEGYGSTTNGPIPANSTLIFVVTLESIS
jgi:FKBP-type peptidyl-prolyl cis-trans isomerase